MIGHTSIDAAAIVTVIIPTYNRASTIGRAIASVENQKNISAHVIVVDDGSTDDTVQIIRSASKKSKILLIKQANRGACTARNTGIDRVITEYVAFLDSDDEMLPDHLCRSVINIQDSKKMISYSKVIGARASDKYVIRPSRAIHEKEKMADYLVRHKGFVQTSTLVMRTEIAKKVRYREDVTFGDDTDFAIRLSLLGCQFKMLSEPSVIWHDEIREDRLSERKRTEFSIKWLCDLKYNIPARAYYGYLGWHVAKDRFSSRPIWALAQYSKAVAIGAYPIRLALIVLAQIIVAPTTYRKLADFFSERDKFLNQPQGVERGGPPRKVK